MPEAIKPNDRIIDKIRKKTKEFNDLDSDEMTELIAKGEKLLDLPPEQIKDRQVKAYNLALLYKIYDDN